MVAWWCGVMRGTKEVSYKAYCVVAVVAVVAVVTVVAVVVVVLNLCCCASPLHPFALHFAHPLTPFLHSIPSLHPLTPSLHFIPLLTYNLVTPRPQTFGRRSRAPTPPI
jgi:hypothetical protein